MCFKLLLLLLLFCGLQLEMLTMGIRSYNNLVVREQSLGSQRQVRMN